MRLYGRGQCCNAYQTKACLFILFIYLQNFVAFDRQIPQSYTPLWGAHVEVLERFSTSSDHEVPHRVNPLEKFSTSSEVPQNHNDLPSTRSQALPP